MAAIRIAPPELIFLDIHLRGMDGFEVRRRIKAFDERREIPLVFTSAAIDAEECVEGLSLGAVDFVLSLSSEGNYWRVFELTWK